MTVEYEYDNNCRTVINQMSVFFIENTAGI